MSAIPLTVRGAERLQEELQRLKTVERPAVINAIAEARAQGDLSENAEYDAARERQGLGADAPGAHQPALGDAVGPKPPNEKGRRPAGRRPFCARS